MSISFSELIGNSECICKARHEAPIYNHESHLLPSFIFQTLFPWLCHSKLLLLVTCDNNHKKTFASLQIKFIKPQHIFLSPFIIILLFVNSLSLFSSHVCITLIDDIYFISDEWLEWLVREHDDELEFEAPAD